VDVFYGCPHNAEIMSNTHFRFYGDHWRSQKFGLGGPKWKKIDVTLVTILREVMITSLK